MHLNENFFRVNHFYLKFKLIIFTILKFNFKILIHLKYFNFSIHLELKEEN